MRRRFFTLIAVFGLTLSAYAQPIFDAASVKIDGGPFVFGVSGRMQGGPGTGDPERFSGMQQSLKSLMMAAYGLGSDRLIGPSWFNDMAGDKYTVIATMPPNTTKEQFQLMLQNLLKERFSITLHHESREFPGYDLIIAHGGPKLQEWMPDSAAEASSTSTKHLDEKGFPILPAGKIGTDLVAHSQPGVAGGRPLRLFRWTHRNSIGEFIKYLGDVIKMANGIAPNEPSPQVKDKTGLSGIYEFRLEFSPSPIRGSRTRQDTEPLTTDWIESGESLFAALEKQLGLRIVKAKAVPVDVLVIDHLERIPSAN